MTTEKFMDDTKVLVGILGGSAPITKIRVVIERVGCGKAFAEMTWPAPKPTDPRPQGRAPQEETSG